MSHPSHVDGMSSLDPFLHSSTNFDDFREDHENDTYDHQSDADEAEIEKQLDQELYALRSMRDEELHGVRHGADDGSDSSSDEKSDGEEFQQLLNYRPRCNFRPQSARRQKSGIISPTANNVDAPFHSSSAASIAATSNQADSLAELQLELDELEVTIDGRPIEQQFALLSARTHRPSTASRSSRPTTASGRNKHSSVTEEKTHNGTVIPPLQFGLASVDKDDGTDKFIETVAHEVDELRQLISTAPQPSEQQRQLEQQGITDIIQWARQRREQLAFETLEEVKKREEEEERRRRIKAEQSLTQQTDDPSPQQQNGEAKDSNGLPPAASPSPRASSSSSQSSNGPMLPPLLSSPAPAVHSALEKSLARSMAREKAFQEFQDQERAQEMKRSMVITQSVQQREEQALKDSVSRQITLTNLAKKEEQRLKEIKAKKAAREKEVQERELERKTMAQRVWERDGMRREDFAAHAILDARKSVELKAQRERQDKNRRREQSAMHKEDKLSTAQFRKKQSELARLRQMQQEKEQAERTERDRLESIRLEAQRQKHEQERKVAEEYAARKREEARVAAEEERKRKEYEAEVLRAKEELLRQKIEAERVAAEVERKRLEQERLEKEEQERQRQESIARELARRAKEEEERKAYFERMRLEKEQKQREEAERLEQERLAELARLEQERLEAERKLKEAEKARVAAEKLARRQQRATWKIQRAWRGHITRKKHPLARKLKEWKLRRAQKRFKAAQIIQALTRGFLLRRKLARIRARAKEHTLGLLEEDDEFDYQGLDPKFYTIESIPEFEMNLPEEAKRMLKNAAEAPEIPPMGGGGRGAGGSRDHRSSSSSSLAYPSISQHAPSSSASHARSDRDRDHRGGSAHSSSSTAATDAERTRLHSAGVASKLSASGRGGLVSSSVGLDPPRQPQQQHQKVNNFFGTGSNVPASASSSYGSNSSHALAEPTKFPRLGTPSGSPGSSPPQSAGGIGASSSSYPVPGHRVNTALSEANSEASFRSADRSSRPEGPSAATGKAAKLAELSAAWGISDPRTLEAMLRKKQKMAKMKGAKKLANMTADERLEKFQRGGGGGGSNDDAGHKKKKKASGVPAAWFGPSKGATTEQQQQQDDYSDGGDFSDGGMDDRSPQLTSPYVASAFRVPAQQSVSVPPHNLAASATGPLSPTSNASLSSRSIAAPNWLTNPSKPAAARPNPKR